MEKQIEEMAKDIHEYVCKAEQGNAIVFNSSVIGCHKLDMAKYLIQEKSYRKQEWISVEDRLPTESYGRYLVYTELGIVDFDIYSAISGWQGYNYVTHWMPLPQPPKMKGAE